MEVTTEHLAEIVRRCIFGRSYHVHSIQLEYAGQNVTIDLRASSAVGIEEMELLFRLFKSSDMTIPVWENVSPGCDTCGDGSLSLLNGLTIRNVCPFEETIREAALIRWEQELDREEAARQAEIARRERAREQEQRRQANLAKQAAAKKLKEQQDALFDNNLEAAFLRLWAVYGPLCGLKQRDFAANVARLPNGLKWLMFKMRKTHDQTISGVRKKFYETCEKAPKKMKRHLFPKGAAANMPYRFIRRQKDATTQETRRALESEGHIVFIIAGAGE